MMITRTDKLAESVNSWKINWGLGTGFMHTGLNSTNKGPISLDSS